MIIISAVLLVVGITFIIRGRALEISSQNRKTMLWIGSALIVMTVFLVIMGILQITDISTNEQGH